MIGTKQQLQDAQKAQKVFFNYAAERLLDEATNPGREYPLSWYDEQIALLEKECISQDYRLAISWMKLSCKQAYENFQQGKPLFRESSWQIAQEERYVAKEQMIEKVIEQYDLTQSRARTLTEQAHRLYHHGNLSQETARDHGRADALLSISQVDWEAPAKRPRLLAEAYLRWKGSMLSFQEDMQEMREKNMSDEKAVFLLRKRFLSTSHISQSPDASSNHSGENGAFRTTLHYEQYLGTSREAAAFSEAYLEAGIHMIEEMFTTS